MRSTVIAAVLTLAACAPTTETTASSTQATTPDVVPVKTPSSRPVIATLETHDRRVSILGGARSGAQSDELRVTVHDREGTVIADGITVQELHRTDPLLGALITNAVAKTAEPAGPASGTYLDATLDLPHGIPGGRH